MMALIMAHAHCVMRPLVITRVIRAHHEMMSSVRVTPAMASSGKYRVMSPSHHGDRGLARLTRHRQPDSSLPPTLLSGVIWHQATGLFSKWREVFLILNRDSLRWHQIQKTASINHHQVGLVSQWQWAR